MERSSIEEPIRANTTRQQAESIATLIQAGFGRDAVVKAVTANNLSLLVSTDHS